MRVMMIAIGLCATSAIASAEQNGTFSNEIENHEHRAGFFDLYVDLKDDRVLAAVPAPDDDGVSLRFIYAARLGGGLGSNPIGLDRGLGRGQPTQLGGAQWPGQVLAFRRVGAKIVVEAENWLYLASADDQMQKKAVRESFARSFLWSTKIIAEDGGSGALLIDLSDFLTRDALGIAQRIADAGEGSFGLAADQSFPDLPNALAFPDNVEIDSFLTMTSDEPGDEVKATTPNAGAITLVQHHSFVRLPDLGYQVRAADPRVAVLTVPKYDFSAPLASPVASNLARRFRLEKTDPTATNSPVKQPIVFYLDPGVAEPVRSALLEGAQWWASAFEAAGFVNGYRVELLPADAHPLDVRYNVIQLVHRQTRGRSAGQGVVDPRTGEMLKGHVLIDSQRVRHVRMIFEGLAGVGKTGSGAPDDPIELALARIRQLAAHEVGHELGLMHNFAGSASGRASVMDYPAPLVKPTAEGDLDFSQAYGKGVGAWDHFTIEWLYREFPPGEAVATQLDEVVRRGLAGDVLFINDFDARPPGGAHPAASIFDNGADAAATLQETMRVRRIALDRFGLANIRDGQSLSDLQAVLVPVYLYHRYQVLAAAKSIGGMTFWYGLRGDGRPGAVPVPSADQRRALAAVLETVDPLELDLPDQTLAVLTPRRQWGWSSMDADREFFRSSGFPAFDVVGAASVAAGVTLAALLAPERASRLIEFHRRHASALSFEEMLDRIEATVFGAEQDEPGRLGEIRHAVQSRFVSELIALGAHEEASAPVRSRVDFKLRALENRLRTPGPGSDSWAGAHNAWLSRKILAHLSRPVEPISPQIVTPKEPPGSPIGADMYERCWHCDSLRW